MIAGHCHLCYGSCHIRRHQAGNPRRSVMDSMRILVIGLAMGIAAVLPARADDNTPLAVKPGLWEMTSDIQHSGAPPIPPDALAKMSPEQRQKVEQMMQGAMAPQHRVDKHCVTAEDIKKGFDQMDQMSHGQC